MDPLSSTPNLADDAFLADVREHDRQVARLGFPIWIGSEPTFTHPRSFQPCWLTEASGGEKETHAVALLQALAHSLSGPARLLRVRGRQYPGETKPRWCLGALFARFAGAGDASPDASLLDAGELEQAPIASPQQAWLTVTPDPGVIEVNMAPAHDLWTFARWSEDVYAAAADAGLSAVRYRFTGDITDSGGGGQLTFGGPSAERSPFFLRPQCLPGLVRYLNRHPSLSYAFAPAFCGSASQGPRSDESARERFDELPVALSYLAARGESCSPAELWQMLAPLLVDSSGCSHRAEVNIEKLWNPGFGNRGELGLVELRALSMPATARRLTAIAALFRAVIARLAAEPYLEPMIDHGAQLHQRFGLPWFLERDLEQVLAELEAHGFGLGPSLCSELRARPEAIATLHLGDAQLELRSAINFWPLVGDVAQDAQHGARLVDSSSARLQLVLQGPRGTQLGQVGANGWRVPMHAEGTETDRCELGSVVYRTFVPRAGLHPYISAHDPLTLVWQLGGDGLQIRLHSWRPEGGGYAGLPADAEEAALRRRERVVIRAIGPSKLRPSGCDYGASLDLRLLHAAPAHAG